MTKITYEGIDKLMADAEADARADFGDEFSDDMVVDLASSVLLGQPADLVQEWCRRNLGFTPASLRPARPVRRACSFPYLHFEAARLTRPYVCGCSH